jgi:hypothetical protein
MRADKSGVPDGGVNWGELQVEFERFPGGLDTGPLLEGLPGDACPCPHWGYVFKGRFLIRYADHEEVVEAGDAFYMAPGHVPVFLEDTEMFELSPAGELRRVLDVVERNAQRLDAGAWSDR